MLGFKEVFTCFLLSFCYVGKAQTTLFEESFTEQTSVEDKFAIYLDSMDKYLYRDIDITGQALVECQNIINSGSPLEDSLQLRYTLSKAYFDFSKAKPLDAYQAIVDGDYLLESDRIPSRLAGKFNYLKGFTFMSIGDLEAAQNAFYKGIELSKTNKDTTLIISNLYSLGQLFNDEGDFEAALKCFNQAIEYLSVSKSRGSTVVLTYIELGETYINNQNYDEGLKALQTAEEKCDEFELKVLKSEILTLKGHVYLDIGEIDKAKIFYNKIVALDEGSKDQLNLVSTQKLLSRIYRAQHNYTKVLTLYEELFTKIDSNNIDNLLELYLSAHEVSQDMGDYESAYKYLIKYSELKSKKDEDLKRQKTAYLKIKYESEQKEKENELLHLKIKQRDSERQSLYGLILLSFLFLTVLFGALYQRMRYSKSLEEQVIKRTEKLKESNELLSKSNVEIDEFNRILAHDMTEPLRSIVGFSQMANRHIIQPEKAKGYLQYVINSGQQLEQLIRDVSTYREAKSIISNDLSECKLADLCAEIIEDIEKVNPNKIISLQCTENVNFRAPQDLLKSIFTIIIDNAVTYNQEDVVSIQVDYELKDNHHVVDIADNGIGIAPEYHADIFKMFTRLNARGIYTGTGLGLSIASKLMEKINGEITLLNSKENVGSTFQIKFPIFS